MENQKEFNTWFYLAIMMLMLCLIFLAQLYENKTTEYDFGNVKIRQSVFNEITTNIGDQPVELCNKAGDCVIVGRLP